MESVVLDKPPEYHGQRDERGFPFEEEDGGAWSDLAARHPDIAARLRPRAPAAAAAAPGAAPHGAAPNAQAFQRKRRPDHADQQDFGANFDGFDRFPFGDIPPEFRGHIPPQYWNRRYEQPPHHPQQAAHHPQHPQQPQSPQPQRQTIATQTDPGDIEPKPIPLPHIPFNQIEGQNQSQGQFQQDQETTNQPQYGLRNTVDPGEPQPDHQEDLQQPPPGPAHHQAPGAHQQGPGQQEHPSMSQEQTHEGNVRVIPIQVEGRDVPVQNHRAASPAAQHPHPHPHPHPHQHPHAAPFDDGFHHPSFAPPPPFRTGFNTNPRPYTNQKAYPQGQYARGMSPQRSHSPKPQNHADYVEIPVQHEAKPQQHPTPQQQQQQYQQQQQQKFQQNQQQQPNQAAPPPPPPQPHAQPQSKDPITQILAIQTDVLKLMTEVENFTGSKKDKQYVYLDEMLTRNLLSLDNIETEGKENIRAARKEAIRCIQKCIAVLESKAEKGSQAAAAAAQDVDMQQDEPKAENGDADNGADKPKENQNAEQNKEGTDQSKVDTKPEENAQEPEKEKKGKKGGKTTKKRDKSKDNNVNKEGMQVDGNSKHTDNAHAMDVDGAASQ